MVNSMEAQSVVVVVEETEAARTALKWAVRNFIRSSDSITLLYVCPLSRSKTKRRTLRRRGFQLALSFKELCNGIAEAKVEIIVLEGDKGASVMSTVINTRASTLVIGLHDESFIYKAPMPNIKCRILAIKQQPKISDGYMVTEFSQVEIRRLCISEPKASFLIFPVALAMLWRKYKRRRH